MCERRAATVMLDRLQAVLRNVAEGVDLPLELADALLDRVGRPEGLFGLVGHLAQHALIEPLVDHDEP
jgi:hypothetical protein